MHDLTRLGEMKWRYRVVEEGESPRDEALALLTEAKDLIESHASHHMEALEREATPSRAPGRRGSGSGPASPSEPISSPRDESSRRSVLASWSSELRLGWAAELSEVCHGLGLTKLIFNTDRSEDEEIFALLKEAMELRQEGKLSVALADTFNALGSLKQKQKKYKEVRRARTGRTSY